MASLDESAEKSSLLVAIPSQLTNFITIIIFFSCSFISSQTLIGLPGEVYTFGTIILLGYFFKPMGVMIASVFYIPVFRQLQVVSVYKV